MRELLSASLLIPGIAIREGVIALPVISANFGIEFSSAIIIFMMFIAYQSSMMTLDLNELNKQSAFIVVSLLSVIATSLVKIHASKTFEFSPIDCSKSEFFAFLLVIFTSFGV